MPLEKIQQEQEQEYVVPYHYMVVEDKLLSFPNKLIACPVYLNYLRVVMDELPAVNGQRILDAGCGDGRFCHELLKKNENVILNGVDYSERAVAFASIINPAVVFKVGDLTKSLPFEDSSFDKVVLIETLEHIAPDRVCSVIKEIHRVLDEDGVFVVTVPHLNRKLDSKHYQHFNSDGLTKILGNYFELISVRGFYKKAPFLDVLFKALLIIYFYLYPLKKVGFKKLIDGISRVGYTFFDKFLRDCGPDEGFSLICVSRKKDVPS